MRMGVMIGDAGGGNKSCSLSRSRQFTHALSWTDTHVTRSMDVARCANRRKMMRCRHTPLYRPSAIATQLGEPGGYGTWHRCSPYGYHNFDIVPRKARMGRYVEKTS